MLSEIIIKTITGCLIAVHLIRVYGLPMRIKRALKMPPAKRIKPFDCEYCLSGWIALLMYFAPAWLVYPAFALFAGAYFSKLLK
jgi:hypothetical protein